MFFGNNRVGLEVLRWLVSEGEDIAAVVVHPKAAGRYTDEIVRASGLPADRIIEAPDLTDFRVLDRIRALRPDIGVSCFFGYIMKQPVLDLFPRGCLNVHPALLPYNRGRHPNIWSIVERTPAGATMHYVDAGVDTGDVISQRRVEASPYDTGATLYVRLEEACIDLFKQTWPQIAAGTARAHPQDHSAATSHRAKDVERIDRIDLARTYTALELIDILRARTFSPYSGAFFEENGERVYLRLQLLKESELGQPPAPERRSQE